jgi:hypothetical protein
MLTTKINTNSHFPPKREKTHTKSMDLDTILLANYQTTTVSMKTSEWLRSEAVVEKVLQNERYIRLAMSCRNQNIRDVLCLELYLKMKDMKEGGIPHNVNYLHIIRILLSSPDMARIHDEMFDELEAIFHTPNSGRFQYECADILRAFHVVRGERLFDEFRFPQPNLTQERVEKLEKATLTIFSDAQNVHDSTINSSVILACMSLISTTKSLIEFVDESNHSFLVRNFSWDTTDSLKTKLAGMTGLKPEKIEFEEIKPVTRFRVVGRKKRKRVVDVVALKASEQELTTFVEGIMEELDLNSEEYSWVKSLITTGSVRDIKIVDIFIAVIKFISNHEKSVELFSRLKEELVDAADVCSTGVVSRLINVLQGFFDEKDHPLLVIRMDLKDEMKAVIMRNLGKACVEGDIDPLFEPDSYKRLACSIVDEHVVACVEEFTEKSQRMKTEDKNEVEVEVEMKKKWEKAVVEAGKRIKKELIDF